MIDILVEVEEYLYGVPVIKTNVAGFMNPDKFMQLAAPHCAASGVMKVGSAYLLFLCTCS